MARREQLFASDSVGPGLVVHESELAEHPGHLVLAPTSATYARLARGEVERLHEALGRWLDES